MDAAEFAEQGEEADESAEPSVSAEGAPAAKAGGESEEDSVSVEVTVLDAVAPTQAMSASTPFAYPRGRPRDSGLMIFISTQHSAFSIQPLRRLRSVTRI